MDDFPDENEILDYHEQEYQIMLENERQLQSESSVAREINKSPVKESPWTGSENLFDSPARLRIVEDSSPMRTPILSEVQNVAAETHKVKRSLQEILDEAKELAEHAKRKKTEELPSEDVRIMKAIAQLRNARKEAEEESALMFSHNRQFKKLEEPTIFRHPPEKSFVSILCPKTSRLCYALLKDDDEFAENSKITVGPDAAKNLLDVQYADLKLMADQERMNRLKRLERSVNEEPRESSDADESNDDGESSLWVDKYRPKSYMDLLSDEGTNRTLLQWLRLWDKIVFGKEFIQKPKTEPEPAKPNTFVRKPLLEFELDDHGRPKFKVALLCGPPGMGKTTLAHTIAKHAGYNVVEVNASDDRSPEVFSNLLYTSTEMQSVLGADRKPNCVIIDEIDGAQAASINVLISFIEGKPSMSKKGKKKEEKASILKRPVICICNDAYAPSLKALKQHALIVNFPPTTSHRLAQRMMKIVKAHKLRSDMTTLMLLCDKAENDIRSCLSTLEFLCTRKRDAYVRMSDIRQAAVGQKDSHKSLFSIWQDIFHTPRPKKHLPGSEKPDGGSESVADTKMDTSMKSRFQNVLWAVQSFGDYEKVAQGVYENFLSVPFKDGNMRSVCAGMDRLCFSDRIVNVVQSTQSYSMLPYLNYTLVLFHFLFSTYSWSKITYPHLGFDAFVAGTKIKNVLESIASDAPVHVRRWWSTDTLVLDILPCLADIIQPTLRPVNTHLYTPQEKAELKRVVDIMIEFNLSYHQERQVDGQYAYQLAPNVDLVVKFSGGISPGLSYSVKQLISRELQLKKLEKPQAEVTVSSNNKMPAGKSKVEKDEDLPSHKRQKLNPKQIDADPEVVKTPRDFFGRPITVVPKEKIEEERNVLTSSGVWYHFKEGYNNAVRKVIRMKDLI